MLWIRLWLLRKCYCCFDLLPRPLKISRYHQKAALLSYHSLFLRVALSVSFKNVSFAFTTWLPIWHKRLESGLSAFGLFFSLNLIISSFWFKENLPFTWILSGHCGVINWLNFNIVSHRTGRPEERERGNGTGSQWSIQNTHIILPLNLPLYVDLVHGAPEQSQ